MDADNHGIIVTRGIVGKDVETHAEEYTAKEYHFLLKLNYI